MKKPNVRSQAGQLIVEAVLIIVLLMAVTFTIADSKGQELIKNLITAPWQSLAGLIQNGSWGTPAKTNVSHPNGHGRHIVITGEPAQ